MDNLPKDITNKIPTIEEFNKNKSGAVSYIFMLCFFLYFFYSEFIKRDDCSAKIASFEQVIIQKDNMIDQLNERVTRLEIALDVKNGIIDKVEQSVLPEPKEVGVSK